MMPNKPPSDLSPRTLRVMALFGLHPAIIDAHPGRLDAPQRAAQLRQALASVQRRTARAPIALIVGPSGSGKSSILHALDQPPGLREHHQRRLLDLFDPAATDQSVLAVLAACGLSDARALVRRAGELSAGQHARLAIALALHRARPGYPVLIDEFASGLDAPTARSLSGTLARLRDRRLLLAPLVLASCHADIVGAALAPDIVARLDSAGGFALEIARPGRSSRRSGPSLSIAPGTWVDYRALAPLHYRAAAPATAVRVLVARTRDRARALVGVMVVSMPTLNGRWRRLAWPDRYQGDRRESTRRLNREVRCLSRVIVDPRYRGVGVGTRLIRAYLDNPLTPATEAVAASGAMCPMFERAGMTRYDLTPTPRDARLADALAERGLPVAQLAQPAALIRVSRDPLLTRELLRWGSSSRATAGARGDLRALAHAAWGALGAPGIAYAAGGQ